MSDILDFNQQLAGSKIFTTLDIEKAYYHIHMAEADMEKTAIITPLGLYEYLVMPNGLKNMKGTWARCLED